MLNYLRADFEAMNAAIDKPKLLDICEQPDLSTAAEEWTKEVLRIADLIIPKTQIKSANTSPWIDDKVIHLSNRKETKRRKAKRTKSQSHWNQYKDLNNSLQSLIHRKYNEYVATCTDQIHKNQKIFGH